MARLLNLRICTDSFAVRIVQAVCFIAGPVILLAALAAVAKFASSPFEVLIGVLAGSTVALLVVLLGFVMPLAFRQVKPEV